MKTNKLGIPIVINNIIDGHSIYIYKYYNIHYYRVFRIIKNNTSHLYGIYLYKSNPCKKVSYNINIK